MSGEFYKWYKNRIDGLRSDPGKESWDYISGVLDKDEKARKPIFRYRYIYILLLLFPALAFFALWQFSAEKPGTKNIALHSSAITQTNNTVTTGNHLRGNTNPEKNATTTGENSANNIHTTPPVKSLPQIMTHGHKVENNSGTDDHALVREGNLQPEIVTETRTNAFDESNIPHSENLVLVQPAFTSEENDTFSTQPQQQPSDISHNDTNISRGKKFYAGMFYNYNNTWLFNSETFSGLKSENLDQTNFSFGSAYGFVAGLYLNPKWSLESNIALHNEINQSYTLFNEGMKYSKQVNLKTSSMTLLCKRNIGKDAHTSHIAVYAGLDAQYVSSYSVRLTNNQVSQDKFYSFNPGMVFGADYTYSGFRGIMVGGGLRSNVGLRNIYGGNNYMPGRLNATTVSCIGLHFFLAKSFGH